MEEKIKLREYMAYGSTDFASNLMWATVSTYLMFFYTDVFGIAVASVGVLLLVVRIFDAFVDPGIGLIIDKTRSKFGKSRPYFLWMAVPFCVFTFLTFTTPELSTTGKLIYAYITYLILSIVFSAVNIPVTSILPRLTSDPNQRNVLTSFRMVGMFLATLFVSIATLPIVNALGGEITQQAQQKGFALTGLIYGLIGAALFIFAFFNLKEKVGVSAQKQSMVDSFKALKGNWPWLILLAICIISQVTLMMRTSSSLYFLKYNLGREDLFPYLGMILIVMLPVFVIIPRLAKRFGKRNLFIIGNIITIIGYILLYFFAETSIPMLFIANAVASLGLGFMGLIFVMISDTIDYGAWRNGIRAEGLLSSGGSFGAKVGTGIGGLLAGVILASAGYNGTAVSQTASALLAIKFNYIVVPLIFTVIMSVLLLFYKLDKILPKITADLKAKQEAEEISKV